MSPEGMRSEDCSILALWLAVLLQVKDDVEKEPFNSIEFQLAQSFLVGAGDWRQSREDIAACIDIDPDAICRLGRRWIAARRLAEGLSPEPTAEPRPKPIPRPPPSEPGKPAKKKAAKRRRVWADNPFNPQRNRT